MRVLTSAEMKQAEADAVAKGTSYRQLMENAGTAAAGEIVRLAGAGEKNILLLAGRGNNAGDAFVVARRLATKGWQCSIVLLCGRAFSPLAAENLALLPSSVGVADGIQDADFSAPVLCDGVFGTGFHGELPQGVRAACEKANATNGLRIALDLPSGLDPDTGHIAKDTFTAHHTLAFGAYKPALVMEGAKRVCGEVHLLDIGV